MTKRTQNESKRTQNKTKRKRTQKGNKRTQNGNKGKHKLDLIYSGWSKFEILKGSDGKMYIAFAIEDDKDFAEKFEKKAKKKKVKKK